jgi:undecaprenol kinase/diacylglycerol kinase (ATP)
MNSNPFSFSKRFHSFKYAFNGLIILIREEHNARIHLIAAVLAIILGFVLEISLTEWISIIFAIGLVVSLEIINSAIENIADFISPENNKQIKRIKDLAAAGVLVGAIASVCIGLIIFLPKIIKIVKMLF